MNDESQQRTVPPWLYKLFTGHQYPYVRRLAKFEKKDRKRGEMSSEPSREEIDAKFWEVYPRSSARILQEVKQGMIVRSSSRNWGPIHPEAIRNWWTHRKSSWPGNMEEKKSR